MPTDLLLITPGFPAHEHDDACIPPLQEYLRALRAMRPQLRIAAIATQYPYTGKPYAWNGIEVFPCDGRTRRVMKWRTWRRANRAVGRMGPVRAVHGLWLGEAAMLGARCAERTGARHVLTLMGRDARVGRRWWNRLRRKPTAVCLSDRHAAVFSDTMGCSPDAVVPWGIDARSKAAASGDRDIDLLWCGSFNGVKDPRAMLDILNGLHDRTDLRSVMVGHGGGAFLDRKHRGLSELIASGRLAILDELPRAQVLQWMARAKVLVHTSRHESQGYVFDEALLNGMSIVSGEVGSARPLPRWRIASNGPAMADAVRELLVDAPSTDPLILHPLERTVNEYLRLYGLA